ncbi:MAG: DUF61 family protein [Candidatus Heimdallarchaeota archaeon]|nr:DUF61 family protein [Candidatus Heimdallarchaeota archaeon]
MGFDNKLGNFLKHEIDAINLHLPKKRVSLSLANKGYHIYVSKDNSQLHLDEKEIEKLLEICPEEKHNEVFLPFLIIRRRDLGQGTYVISGELIDQFMILKVLEKYDGTWVDFIEKPVPKHSTFLYKPDLINLRKALPTSTVIGFA